MGINCQESNCQELKFVAMQPQDTPPARTPPALRGRMMTRAKGPAIMALVLTSAVLSACQTEGPNPLKSTAQLTGFATTAPEAKDFVKESRRGEQPFIPVGTRVERDARRMTSQEFKAIEADLDKIRAKNEQAGAAAKAAGSTPPPAPLKLPQ